MSQTTFDGDVVPDHQVSVIRDHSHKEWKRTFLNCVRIYGNEETLHFLLKSIICHELKREGKDFLCEVRMNNNIFDVYDVSNNQPYEILLNVDQYDIAGSCYKRNKYPENAVLVVSHGLQPEDILANKLYPIWFVDPKEGYYLEISAILERFERSSNRTSIFLKIDSRQDAIRATECYHSELIEDYRRYGSADNIACRRRIEKKESEEKNLEYNKMVSLVAIRNRVKKLKKLGIIS